MNGDAHGNLRGKRLVVFGCGYVGSEVARQAVARGASVTALTRNGAKAAALREAGVTTVVADLADTGWHADVAGGADFGLNSVSSGGGGLEGYRRSYAEGMASVLAWARTRGPVGTLVYTSSTSVYPQGEGAVVDERAPTGGNERADVLVEAERRLRESAGACGRWFVLRLAGIYGPGRHHLLEQVRAGEIAGRGGHRLNLAQRDDIAAAVWACFEARPEVANEIFNVADDAPAPKAEVVRWLAARLGVAEPRFVEESAQQTHGRDAVGTRAEANHGRDARATQPYGRDARATQAPNQTHGQDARATRAATRRRAVTPDRVIANAKIKAVLGWRPRYRSFREGYESLLSF